MEQREGGDDAARQASRPEEEEEDEEELRDWFRPVLGPPLYPSDMSGVFRPMEAERDWLAPWSIPRSIDMSARLEKDEDRFAKLEELAKQLLSNDQPEPTKTMAVVSFERLRDCLSIAQRVKDRKQLSDFLQKYLLPIALKIPFELDVLREEWLALYDGNPKTLLPELYQVLLNSRCDKEIEGAASMISLIFSRRIHRKWWGHKGEFRARGIMEENSAGQQEAVAILTEAYHKWLTAAPITNESIKILSTLHQMMIKFLRPQTGLAAFIPWLNYSLDVLIIEGEQLDSIMLLQLKETICDEIAVIIEDYDDTLVAEVKEIMPRVLEYMFKTIESLGPLPPYPQNNIAISIQACILHLTSERFELVFDKNRLLEAYKKLVVVMYGISKDFTDMTEREAKTLLVNFAFPHSDYRDPRSIYFETLFSDYRGQFNGLIKSLLETTKWGADPITEQAVLLFFNTFGGELAGMEEFFEQVKSVTMDAIRHPKLNVRAMALLSYAQFEGTHDISLCWEVLDKMLSETALVPLCFAAVIADCLVSELKTFGIDILSVYQRVLGVAKILDHKSVLGALGSIAVSEVSARPASILPIVSGLIEYGLSTKVDSTTELTLDGILNILSHTIVFGSSSMALELEQKLLPLFTHVTFNTYDSYASLSGAIATLYEVIKKKHRISDGMWKVFRTLIITAEARINPAEASRLIQVFIQRDINGFLEDKENFDAFIDWLQNISLIRTVRQALLCFFRELRVSKHSWQAYGPALLDVFPERYYPIDHSLLLCPSCTYYPIETMSYLKKEGRERNFYYCLQKKELVFAVPKHEHILAVGGLLTAVDCWTEALQRKAIPMTVETIKKMQGIVDKLNIVEGKSKVDLKKDLTADVTRLLYKVSRYSKLQRFHRTLYTFAKHIAVFEKKAKDMYATLVRELDPEQEETFSDVRERYAISILRRIPTLTDICCAFITAHHNATHHNTPQPQQPQQYDVLLPMELEEKLRHGGRECDVCEGLYWGEAVVESVVLNRWADEEKEIEKERRRYCSLSCFLKREGEFAALLTTTSTSTSTSTTTTTTQLSKNEADLEGVLLTAFKRHKHLP